MSGDTGGALSVGELTRRVKTLLEEAFPELWVRGEISNLRIQSSGHAYFTLRDEGAQVAAVMFRGDVTRSGLALRDGMKIAAFGRVSVYEARGAYQLVVRAALDDGEGRLRREFEALKARLAAEGLFDAARKRPLPEPARRVAIVTSPTGAALRDFVSVLQRRGWCGELTVIPARVQGAGAGAEIVAGLGKTRGYDLVVIARGGGSLEDLWAFNEEPVARAVAASTTPVLSAVGHETDFTLADFAADKRAETPTAAAELISSAYLACLRRLDDADTELHQAARRLVETAGQRLRLLDARLRAQSPEARFARDRRRMAEAHTALHRVVSQALRLKERQLLHRATRLTAHAPERRFALATQRLAELDGRLARATTRLAESARTRLDHTEARLLASGVEATLRRGFAMVADERGRPVTHRAEVKDGKPLVIRFADGVADATGGRSLF